MKKKILLILLVVASFSLVGCGKKEESFEDKVVRKFTYVDSAQKETDAKIEDLLSQVDILKREVGISDTPKFTDEEINFSSIKVAAKSAKEFEDSVTLAPNSEFNLSIDVMNTTEENLSQLIVQAYVTYKLDGKYFDRHLVDTRFDVLPKSVRKEIKFEGIPTKGANYEHILTVIIKDVNGNAITTFNKKINVK